MTDQIQIVQLSTLPSDIEVLRTEAAGLGFGFMDRLVSDWVSGANTFSRPGERLLAARRGLTLVGIGGLNRDPYAHGSPVGRIRHVYVLEAERGQRVGKALVDGLLQAAKEAFSEVRLRTDTTSAAAFYIRCGFIPIEDATASHRLRFDAPD